MIPTLKVHSTLYSMRPYREATHAPSAVLLYSCTLVLLYYCRLLLYYLILILYFCIILMYYCTINIVEPTIVDYYCTININIVLLYSHYRKHAVHSAQRSTLYNLLRVFFLFVSQCQIKRPPRVPTYGRRATTWGTLGEKTWSISSGCNSSFVRVP